MSGMKLLELAARGLGEQVDAMESDLLKTKEDIERDQNKKNQIEYEICMLKARVRSLDENLVRLKEEKIIVQTKVAQGRTAKQTIENGMKVLLDTLEREERVIHKIADNNEFDDI